MAFPLRSFPFIRMRQTAPTAVESALATTVAALPSQAISVEGMRGGRIIFYSNGADNETAVATLYAIDQIHPNERAELGGDPTIGGFRCESMGTITITLGGSLGIVGTAVPVAHRYADTLVWAPTAFGTALLTYVGGNVGTPVVAADTIAEILVSDFGNAQYIAVVFTTYTLTAGRAINAIVKVDL